MKCRTIIEARVSAGCRLDGISVRGIASGLLPEMEAAWVPQTSAMTRFCEACQACITSVHQCGDGIG